EMVEELRVKAGHSPKEPPAAAPVNPLIDVFHKRFYDDFRKRKLTEGKAERANAIKELRERVQKEYLPEDKEPEHDAAQVSAAFHHLEERVVRDMILEGKRMDGRN